MQKVLLVNDSKFECVVLKDILFNLGYDIIITDEYDAMRLAQNHNPDYVIANYIMKQIRGDQLITLIKMQNSNIKCILSSSNPINLDDFRYKRIDAVFQTPIDRVKLFQLISNINASNATSKSQLHAIDSTRNIQTHLIPEDTNMDKQPCADEGKSKTPYTVVNLAFCPNCGNNLDNDSKKKIAFCPYCGSKL